MRLTGMGQLAAVIKESFATITVDRHTEENNISNVAPISIQSRYTDSVEFSKKALELLMETDTETDSKAEPTTNRRQKENTDASFQQEQEKPVPERVIELNVIA